MCSQLGNALKGDGWWKYGCESVPEMSVGCEYALSNVAGHSTVKVNSWIYPKIAL
jgi:hypothetical protein